MCIPADQSLCPGGGRKPVYLYQPMSDVTDVEDKMAVFLETGSVLTPKNLWYTGLSRIEKYPLMQALDKKRSRWNGWISMPLWAQRVPGIGGWLWHLRRMRSNMPGEQLAAYSDKTNFVLLRFPP